MMRRAIAAALLAALCLAAGLPEALADNYYVWASGAVTAKTPQNWGMGEFNGGGKRPK